MQSEPRTFNPWWRQHPVFGTLTDSFKGCNNQESLAFMALTGLDKAGWIVLERARLAAMMVLLVDSGDMTPTAVRQIDSVLGAEKETPDA